VSRDHWPVNAADHGHNAELVDRLRRPDAPRCVTVRETAAVWRTSTAAVYAGIHSRRLPFPYYRIGRSIRIPVKPMLAALGYEVEDADSARCEE
jgi:hypothetical protein